MSGDTTSLMKVGPPNRGLGGEAWEMKDTEIYQIFVAFDDYENICGLQFQFVKDGKRVLSQIFGELSGQSFEAVKFKDANEYITGLSGNFAVNSAVNSIAIKTNARKYGPIGKPDEYDHKFSFRFGPENQFGGFYGTFGRRNRHCNIQLTSIGVHLKPSSN